jgi:Flagellar hook-length control protein FliK
VIKPPGPSVSKVGAVAPGSPPERVRGDAGSLLVAVVPAPIHGPGFKIGEAVTARLIEPLQNRQWLAVVKGSVLTLQLPVAAEPGAAPDMMRAQGETLSLQVASLKPRLSFVLAGAAAASASSNAVAVLLSGAARTLTELLQAAGADPLVARPAAPESLPVLLGNPAAPPAERAQALAQAISHSGLFYESHLLAWAEGRLPLSSLGREPQARIGEALKDAAPSTREAAGAELGAVLRRQLDALDGKPLAFTGFAWPGQPAEWRIQREPAEPRDDESAGQHRPNDGSEPTAAWTTQIQLKLPRLGALGAHLRVAGSQLTLAMTLADDTAAELLAAHRDKLASALQAAGMTLAALTVHRQPNAPDGLTEKT